MVDFPKEKPIRGDQRSRVKVTKHEEMTLRDWFAGRALMMAWDARDKGYYEGDDNDMAVCAYQVADAMIAARKNNTENK